MEAKIKELYENEEFIAKMKQADTSEDVKNVFAEYGVELSVEDIEEIYNECVNAENGELGEENLDQVSGGSFIAIGACFVGGYIIGRLITRFNNINDINTIRRIGR